MTHNKFQETLLSQVESQFFERLGIKDLSDSEVTAYKAQLAKLTKKRLSNVLLEILSPQELSQLDQAKTNEEIGKIFTARELNFDQITAAVLASVLQEVETDMAYINGLIDAAQK